MPVPPAHGTARPDIALVTGASSGIGERVVRDLMAAGLTVYAAARRVERMAALAEEGARVLAMDVTDAASVEAGVARIEAEAGGVDVLVNNAGYGSYGSVEEVPDVEARRQFDVNLFGLAHLTRRVLPGMRQRGRGRIINVSSIAGTLYEPLGAWYHASKAALDRFSDCLRVEVAPFGVRVVTVRPASIRTEWNEGARESLHTVSGRGPYAAQVPGVTFILRTLESRLLGNEVDAVGRDVVRAATAARPSPVIASGRGAAAAMWAFRTVPTALMDEAVAWAVRAGSRRGGR